MEVVINIPENVYRRLKAGDTNAGNTFHNTALESISNGIVLPKGHGELVDKDAVLDMMNYGILEEYITTMSGVIPADK